MAKTYNRMNIEIGKPINSIGIHPVEGDTNSRYLDVSLYNNGVPINLTGERVRINFLKENGLSFFNQGEITDAAAGRCQFALTNDVLSEAEALKAQISIWGIGGEILSTETFNIYVSENIRCDEAVEGTNEFGVLVVLFQEIQNALDLMQRISDGFGEPGKKAAEYGVNTFWGILEVLAGRSDVEHAIKAFVNSTIDTENFKPLNEFLINEIIPNFAHGVQTFTSDGIFTVPKGVHKIFVTACGGGAGGNSGAPYLAYKGNPGENGTSTVVGSLIVIPGGFAGIIETDGVQLAGGKRGGIGGGDGGEGSITTQPESTTIFRSSDGDNGIIDFGLCTGEGGSGDISGSSIGSGGGGGGSLGRGGDGGSVYKTLIGQNGEKGGGGGGGAGSTKTGNTGGYGGGGGGGAAAIKNMPFNVTENQKIQITIGKGGNGGAPATQSGYISYAGGNGGDGIVIIEW